MNMEERQLSERKLTFPQKCFLILIVLTSGTELTLSFAFPSYLLLLVFLVLIIKGEIRASGLGNSLVYLLVLTGIWLVQFLIYGGDRDSIVSLAKSVAMVWMVFLFTGSKPQNNAARFQYIVHVIIAFSLVSNILFVAVLLKLPVPSFYSSSHGTPTVFYLEQYMRSSYYGVFGYRNCGIYWEPGMYQIFMNLLLIYWLYCKGISERRRTILAAYCVLTVLSTGSITGYITCAAVLAIFAFINSKNVFFKVLIIGAVVVVVILLLPRFNEMMTAKRTFGQSMTLRTNDISLGFETFLKRPILGHGLENHVYEFAYRTAYGSFRGETNGMFSLLIDFGLVGAVVYVLHFARFVRMTESFLPHFAWVSFTAWFVISLNTEPIAVHNFTLFLLAIGFNCFSRIRFVFQHKQSHRLDELPYSASEEGRDG